MKRYDHLKQNIINILVCLVCVAIILSGNFIFAKLSNIKDNIKTDIEIEWRLQAKRTLVNLQNQFMYDIEHNTLDPLDKSSLHEWSKRNISGILNGGDTGRVFMVNLADGRFIWDDSLDCSNQELINTDRFISIEAPLHVEKTEAARIIDKMNQGISTTTTYDKNSWNFDGSIEYLEWVVMPPGFLGFNNESKNIGGVKNKDYNKILIGIRTRKNEIESTFNYTFKTIDKVKNVTNLFVTLSIVVCIFNMIVYVFLKQRKKS